MDNHEMYDGIDKCSTFVEFLEKINEAYGDLAAFRSRDGQWSYHDLYLLIQSCRPYFTNHEATYFSIAIETPIYFCAVFLAVAISGKIALLGRKEQFHVDDAVEIDMAMLPQITSNDAPVADVSRISGRDASVIALSSGTTSIAKGVMLSQYNLLSDTFAGAMAYGYSRNSVYLNILPYTHLFGIVADMLGPLASGGTICFSCNKLDFFRDMQFFQPTHMNLPPAIVYTIEKAIVQTQNPSYITGGKLKKIMCAGAKINDSSICQMREYGIEVLAAYGLTECSPCISMNSSTSWKMGSVGKILPCCKVKIENDEILVSGDNVMIGYWKDEEATRQVLHDGWLHTGDLGYMDKDGFLFLTGRKSSILVLENGKKVIPETIEQEICRIPSVDEALLSSLSVGNRILLQLIVVTPGNDDKLLSKVKSVLEKYKIGDRIDKVMLSSSPLEKNALGKIKREGTFSLPGSFDFLTINRVCEKM